MDMERDFRYLRDKYGDAGARDIFEKICTQLFHVMYQEEVHNIKVSQGDGGIDIAVGDFSKPIINYQCKYFLDGLDEPQKQQIRNSFTRAIGNDTYKMSKWGLCLPCTLSVKEFEWWSKWKEKQERNNSIEITLLDGSYLLSKLKQYDIYEKEFDEDVRNSLEEILEILTKEKKRLTEEIIELVSNIDQEVYEDMLFVKKLEMANIELVDSCIGDFFNAELVEHIIKSKGDDEKIKVLNNLKLKVLSFWQTQYRRYSDEADGNELLARTYERIEDADTTTLNCEVLPEISLIAKKGMLHQWAEECSVGWIKGYKQKLEQILNEGPVENEN